MQIQNLSYFRRCKFQSHDFCGVFRISDEDLSVLRSASNYEPIDFLWIIIGQYKLEANKLLEFGSTRLKICNLKIIQR